MLIRRTLLEDLNLKIKTVKDIDQNMTGRFL